MLEITDRRIGQRLAYPALPPHPTPRDLLADALPILDPPSLTTVTEAAERHVRVPVQGNWQAYDRSVTPYMVEPQDMTSSRRYSVVAFLGPAQSGKTLALQSTAMHRATCDPMPVLIVHMTKTDRDKWVESKFDPMIQNSPAVRDLLGKGRDDSTFSRKRFRGMRIELGYPTPTQLSSATYGLVALTDYDHMKMVLGQKDAPEGTPMSMARQRVRTYLSRGCVMVESSPAFPWSDPSWHPVDTAPHAMPPVTGGIVQVYNEGTRGRWYWQCPDCDDLFEPRFDRLSYDDQRSPREAGETAEMVCPHCGVAIAHRHKLELNRAALAGKGGWLHEAENGTPVPIGDEAVRSTDIVSYALNGAVATFGNWRELVARYEMAKAKLDELDDPTDLAQVHYTDIGVPFRPTTFDKDGSLGAQFLRDHAQKTPQGLAPDWSRFVTVSVDVQAARFPVQVMAWGEDARSQIIDRFDLITPPSDAPNAAAGVDTRALDPARYVEDWSVLLPLAHRVYPVEAAGYGLAPLGCVIDFHGAPGVSDNAEAFLRARRRSGEGGLWFLARGHGGLRLPRRVWYEAPERGSRGKAARSIRLLNFATDRLKDTISAALGKAEGGVGALYCGAWQEDGHLEEFVAEDRGDKGWQKRPGKTRNESIDLSCMGRALAEHKGLTRLDWSNPPGWAVLGSSNLRAVENTENRKPDISPRAAPRRISFLKR
jgi:phage terminase large subunit GpA-like protein